MSQESENIALTNRAAIDGSDHHTNHQKSYSVEQLAFLAKETEFFTKFKSQLQCKSCPGVPIAWMNKSGAGEPSNNGVRRKQIMCRNCNTNVMFHKALLQSNLTESANILNTMYKELPKIKNKESVIIPQTLGNICNNISTLEEVNTVNNGDFNNSDGWADTDNIRYSQNINSNNTSSTLEDILQILMGEVSYMRNKMDKLHNELNELNKENKFLLNEFNILKNNLNNPNYNENHNDVNHNEFPPLSFAEAVKTTTNAKPKSTKLPNKKKNNTTGVNLTSFFTNTATIRVPQEFHRVYVRWNPSQDIRKYKYSEKVKLVRQWLKLIKLTNKVKEISLIGNSVIEAYVPSITLDEVLNTFNHHNVHRIEDFQRLSSPFDQGHTDVRSRTITRLKFLYKRNNLINMRKAILEDLPEDVITEITTIDSSTHVNYENNNINEQNTNINEDDVNINEELSPEPVNNNTNDVNTTSCITPVNEEKDDNVNINKDNKKKNIHTNLLDFFQKRVNQENSSKRNREESPIYTEDSDLSPVIKKKDNASIVLNNNRNNLSIIKNNNKKKKKRVIISDSDSDYSLQDEDMTTINEQNTNTESYVTNDEHTKNIEH
jgi:hypothetical protein